MALRVEDIDIDSRMGQQYANIFDTRCFRGGASEMEDGAPKPVPFVDDGCHCRGHRAWLGP